MSYQLRGWTSQVVELAFEMTDSDTFWDELKSDPHLHMFVKQTGNSSGQPTFNALVAGQQEAVIYLEVACPAHLAATVWAALDAALKRSFPRPPAG